MPAECLWSGPHPNVGGGIRRRDRTQKQGEVNVLSDENTVLLLLFVVFFFVVTSIGVVCRRAEREKDKYRSTESSYTLTTIFFFCVYRLKSLHAYHQSVSKQS